MNVPPGDGFGRHDRAFRSDVVDRVRAEGDIWNLPGGQLLLPEVFGFCRGVQQALKILQRALDQRGGSAGGVFLLGEIIHNPWVNDYFRHRGVRILSRRQLEELDRHLAADDCAVIPAFGVAPQVQQRLATIGCEVVDTTCGDVRRLWAWAEKAVASGYAVLVFGRARHDETVVTKSRLAAAGGRYLVVGDLEETRALAELLGGQPPAGALARCFGPEQTNAESAAALERLAVVSQTTMLYEETLAVRRVVRRAMIQRFGAAA